MPQVQCPWRAPGMNGVNIAAALRFDIANKLPRFMR
jgi:hypothetical protein